MDKKFTKLFENLCCSQCKTGFDEESVTIKRMENDLLVIQLKCKNCGKNFGIAFAGFSQISVKEPLEVRKGPDAITYDDVIDAHRFIRNLDEHWQDYLPKKGL